jgi:hypothetical protein
MNRPSARTDLSAYGNGTQTTDAFTVFQPTK